jgi:hypothetical protein
MSESYDYDRHCDSLSNPPAEEPPEMNDPDLRAMAMSVRADSLDSDARMVARWALELMGERDDARTIASRRLAQLEELAVIHEHSANEHMASLRHTLATLDEMSADREAIASTTAKIQALAAEAIKQRDRLQVLVARLEPLADAVRAYVKHRYFPRLSAAWDRYLAPKE